MMLLSMGEDKRQMFQYSSNVKEEEDQQSFVMEGDNYITNNTTPLRSEDSIISDGSFLSSSLDITDDDASSSSGSFYDLSEFMAQLPIKRGLSKYYQGKSESFTSLSRVTSIEVLAKKPTPFRKKMKAGKIYEGGLDTYKSYSLPKPIISKKSSKCLFSSSPFPSRRGSFFSSCRSPMIPDLKYRKK